MIRDEMDRGSWKDERVEKVATKKGGRNSKIVQNFKDSSISQHLFEGWESSKLT